MIVSVRTLIAAGVVAALAVGGGIVGRTIAAERPAHGPYSVPAGLSGLSPSIADAILAADGVGGSAEVRLGVTPEFATEGALSLLAAASAELDPEAALPAAAATPGTADECVVAGGDRPAGCPPGLNASVVGGETGRLQVARVAGAGECDGTAVLVGASTASATVHWWSAREAIRSVTVNTGGAPVCVPLNDLTAATRYGVQVSAGDQTRRFVLASDGAPERPGAAFYAPTPDLIAVTVPHREGETVEIFPNVLSGSSEPQCDEVTIGYDLFVHPLGSVHATVPAAELEAARLDPAYTERTTFAFDIGEGHTVFLCAVVTTPGGEIDYTAQTIVETADRVTPVFRIVGASVPDVPEWGVSATLADGQGCGQWMPPAGVVGELTLTSERPVLCDPTDELGSQVEGRGVLPFSTARPTSLTVQLGSPQWGQHTASIDLGAGARCTGFCEVPDTGYFEVADGQHGSVTVEATWGQGNTNGASRTTVAPVQDSLSVLLPGPVLDVATARSVVVSGDDASRGVTANMYIRADGEVDFVARLVPAEGEAACERPGARLEVSGHLADVRPVDAGIIEPGEWSATGNLRFTGLCHGTVYRAVVELTDAAGRTTVWGQPGGVTEWGVSSLLPVPAIRLTTVITIQVEGEPTGGAASLSLYADGLQIAGPVGDCLREGQAFVDTLQLPVPYGETTRFSGSLVYQPADTSGFDCAARPMDALAAIPFAVTLDLDAFADTPGLGVGIVLRHPDGTQAGLIGITPVAGIAG